MSFAREDIFGLVVKMMGFDTEAAAVAFANDSEYGLSAWVHGPTREKAENVGRQLRVGMVHINGAPSDLAAPFGGYKRSGNGREWGMWGLEEYLETKAVMGVG
jgi:acyl-CoA reductase-like NAD-dependent aldehyde dehydrogenase